MIDHISLVVSDLEKSRDFYRNALLPLGYDDVHSIEDVDSWDMGFRGCSVGNNDETRLWMSPGTVQETMHIAFAATNHAEVDAFYKAAIAAGGEDNGAPGIREMYSPTYYAAFVKDPDGNNIEVVCRK